MFFKRAENLLLAVLAIGAAAAFAPNASAQEVGEFRNATNVQMKPGIRYTTGVVTTAGWERNLTDGDPNLKRWNWSAMTSYTQSTYNHVAPGAFAKRKDAPEVAALRPAGSIYVKPIQVSPEINARRRPTPAVIIVGNNNANANVSGRIRTPQQHQIAALAPQARMYNSYGVNGSLLTPTDSDAVASRNVSGRLVRMQ